MHTAPLKKGESDENRNNKSCKQIWEAKQQVASKVTKEDFQKLKRNMLYP